MGRRQPVSGRHHELAVENMYGGDGFWMFEDPSDPNYIYAEYQGGNIGRVNRQTHELRAIQPLPNYNEKLRYNWNTPIALSPNEKGTIYIGAQFLFRSRDHGQSWDRISPDLSTNDPQKQKQEESGGVTVDNSAAETHTTIYSISIAQGRGHDLVGTDDGQRAGHARRRQELDEHREKRERRARAFVGVVGAGRQLRRRDRVRRVRSPTRSATWRRTIYATSDYGKSWKPLVTPKDSKGLVGYVHVIKQDTVKPEILYAAPSSVCGSRSMQEKRGRSSRAPIFPAVAVRDLAFQNRDASLALATHGRGIWIIDDLTPLRALDAKALDAEAAFLPTNPIQQRINAVGGWSEGDASFAGPNPAGGAEIVYYQKGRHLFGKLRIDILDDKGNVIDTIPQAFAAASIASTGRCARSRRACRRPRRSRSIRRRVRAFLPARTWCA